MVDHASPRKDPKDIIGRVLLALAAATCVVLVFTSRGVADDDPAIYVHIWHFFGLVLTAGFFAVLAARPRQSAGVWELLFMHRLAMFIAALGLPAGAAGRTDGMVEGGLALVLVVAYFLCRGYLSWNARPGVPGTRRPKGA